VEVEIKIMSSIPIEYFLILSAFMFVVGVAGVLIRRNAIVVFMCIELMLNSANLSLVTFSSYLGNPIGQIFVFFVMTVAAAEAAVGLAIIIAIFRNKLTVNIDEINIFKW
jgi:NADH-quinone oxidoreductase subunit K